MSRQRGAFLLIDPGVAALIAFAFFSGCVVKGVTGMGMPLVAIAMMSLVLDVRDATPMILGPALAANVYQIAETRRARLPFIKLLPILIGLIGGTFLGVKLAVTIDPTFMLGILGVLLIGFVILSLFRLDPVAPELGRGPLGLVAGGFTGFIGSMTGGFGVILAMYLLSLRWPREAFMWALGVLLLLSAGSLGIFYAALGAFPAWVFYASLAAIIPACAGMWAGSKLRKMISPDGFRRIVLSFLAVIAVKHLVTVLGAI